MEVTDPTVSPDEFVYNFRDEFTRRTGTGLIVYANLSWWQTLLHPDQWADDRTWLWLALYNGQPTDTGGWTHRRLAIHQSTDKGAVPGFVGLVDRDETVNGFSLADLTIGGTKLSGWLELWKNKQTGDVARVFDNGVITSIALSDYQNAVNAGQCAIIEVDDGEWQDQAKKSDSLVRGNTVTISIDQATLVAAIKEALNLK